jgi:hypothetical protein
MAGYNNTMPESWNRLLATRDIRNSEYENVLKSL